MPTALITGANRGLGLEFARQYAVDGWNVIACTRQPAKATALKKLADEHKTIHIETLDVGDQASIQALAIKLKDTPIDLLINNAGIYSGTGGGVGENDDSQDFGHIDTEAWEIVLRTNTIAPIMVLEAFVPHLAKSEEPKAVMVTSKMGSIAEMGSGYIAYRTSKAALNAAMVVVSHELKSHKISIINMHPGWVQTDMGGPNAPLKSEASVSGMRKVIAGMTLAKTGQFIGYDGKIIAW